MFVICLFNSQMSNLMNQARLKVLKARDDMISVSNCASTCHRYMQIRQMQPADNKTFTSIRSNRMFIPSGTAE